MDFNLSERILYIDDALLVVDKPAGLPTLVDGWNPEAPYLLGLLREKYGPLWVVHRLDRETSGVIVFARTAEAHRSLNMQFEGRKMERVEKVYHAVAAGAPEWDEKTVKLPLRSNAGHRHRTVVNPRRGKPAHTDFRVLRRLDKYTLVEAQPHTGRTHQIRVHLAAVGLPIVGDKLYGPPADGDEINTIPRAALHAYSLRLLHPTMGRKVVFEAPYPDDFKQLLKV
jgi:RluA family pseudouridine synthase